MVTRYQSDNQKIISKWEKKKGGIENAQQKWAEVTQVDEEAEEMAEKARQAEILSTIRFSTGLNETPGCRNCCCDTFRSCEAK